MAGQKALSTDNKPMMDFPQDFQQLYSETLTSIFSEWFLQDNNCTKNRLDDGRRTGGSSFNNEIDCEHMLNDKSFLSKSAYADNRQDLKKVRAYN